MFSETKYVGNIAFLQSDFSWGDDVDTIAAILSQYFEHFNDNGFYAHPQEVELRAKLAEVPTLAGLTEALRALPAHGFVVKNLGLEGLPEQRRNGALYALTLMLGFPTSTDRRTGRVAWDVKARPVEGGGNRFTTFSERVGSADMHTDSSFYPMPEEQFILYVVNAARCQGGHSILMDSADIHEALLQSPEGRAAFELLSTTPVPFRVPAVYAAGDDHVEVHMATVFGAPKQPGMPYTLRWRHDSIMKGLAARPEMGTPELLGAIDIVNQIAETGTSRFKEQLPTDTLLLVDNHHMLHGRTTYEDERRHLIRIRISDLPNAERIGPSGVVQD